MDITGNGRVQRRITAFDQDKLRIVATRGAIHGGVTTVQTTPSRGESRLKVTFGPQASRDVCLVYGNFKASGSAAEVAGANAITVEAAIETITPTVAYAQVTWGGKTSVVIEPGAIVVSDPLPLDFDASSAAWIRTGVVVTVGQSWPLTSMFAITGEAMVESTEATSQIFATGAMANRNGAAGSGGYIPLAIIGKTEVATPAIGLLGDSIMAGTVGDGSSNVTGARGMYARGLYLDNGTVLPWSLLARASELAAYNSGVSGYRRRQIFDYCTHVIVNYGTNDIAAANSLATIQGNLSAIWKSAKRRGVKVIQSKILPRTTSSNSFVDAVGQTIATGFTVGGTRDLLNDWFDTRLAAGEIDGLINANTVAEDPAAHGKWVSTGATNYITSDGTHPNNAGCLLLAPVIKAVVTNFTV